MGPLSVLFVCTGNICRSPMAHGLLEDALAAGECEQVMVASAGTWAAPDIRATSEAVSVLADRGVDLSQHRSRPLVAQEVDRADLVIAMTSVHLREIEQLAPGSGHKVRLIKELPELEPDFDDSMPPRQRLHALLAAQRPAPRRDLDLDDPIGLPISAYQRCLRELSGGVEVLVDVLCTNRRTRTTDR